MILKYKVPEQYKKIFNNKKVIYCKIISEVENLKPKIYKVKMINFMNLSNIFNEKHLKKLNIIDKIKVFYIKRRDTNEKI